MTFNSNLFLRYVILITLMFFVQFVFGQEDNFKSLERKKEQIQNKLNKTKQLLNETRKVKKKSFNELVLIKKQINLMEQLLNSLNNQIVSVDYEIARMEGLVGVMESDLNKFKDSYAKTVYLTYKSKSNLSVLLWVLSSNNFKQAYDRIIYFREFTKYKHDQIRAIKKIKLYVSSKKNELEYKKNKKKVLMDQRVSEKNELAVIKNDKDKLYTQLKMSEKDYNHKLKQYKRDLAKIRSEIRRLVVESRRVKEKNVEKEEKISIAEKKLSSYFEKNKGKLPWPVSMSDGIITGYFGKTQTATGGEVINDGIYISSPSGTKVRAVFGGVVTMIGKIPSYGKVVIVQHGDFRSVYANLESVYVEKGDSIETLKEIGKIKTNTMTGETQLYFQIYRDFNPVNPMVWIMNK